MKYSNLIDVFEMFWNKFLEWIPELITAIILLVLGIWIIRFIAKRLRKTKLYTSFEPSIAHFGVISVKIVLYVILFMIIVSMLGIPMTSFIAILGSIGIAIGLALQGHLSNIAAGIEILILKPISDGDFVQIAGNIGTVKKIRLFFTVLLTIDNKQVIIPNNVIVTTPLLNFNEERIRQLDLRVGISYSSNIQVARDIILNLLTNDPRVNLEIEKPYVAVAELADSSVNLLVRAWTSSEHFMNLQWEFLEKVKMEFDKNGVEIPFPQLVVHKSEN